MLFGSDCNNNMLRDVTKVKRGETVGLGSLAESLQQDTIGPTFRPVPDETVTPMPAQDLTCWDTNSRVWPDCDRALARRRRTLVFAATLALTAAASYEMYQVLNVSRMTVLQVALLVVFTVNFVWIALPCVNGLIGFVALWGGRGVSGLTLPALPLGSALTTRTALLMPIYNEAPQHVFAGLQAIYESLEALGALDHFDLFILSDTTDPDIWLEEEVAFWELRQRTQGERRIFYRHRLQNIRRKAGNIADFCRRWGAQYAHMVVLDADSVMTGQALVQLVAAMETHADAGLIQTLPLVVQRHTLLARAHQFAARLYGPVIATGLAYWHRGESNYWGHNAIIRTTAFIAHAGLPDLPGQPPFGGHIMSHDFVEAALLRRAGWKVYLAPDITGSYEESPPSLLAFAERDRRWCQGNLQHSRVVPAAGLHWLSRLHLVMGIMSYLASPIWLLFIILGMLLALQAQFLRPAYFPKELTLFPTWPIFDPQRALRLFVCTMAVLLAPKVCGYLLLWRDRQTLRCCGGALRTGISVVVEIVVSSLIAPVMMLMQSTAVLGIVTGRDAGWQAQRRDAGSISLRALVRRHRSHTVCGVILAVVAYTVSPVLLAWMAPVVLGLVLAIPVSVATGWPALGHLVRRLGLLLTPEERHPPAVLQRAHELACAWATACPQRTDILACVTREAQLRALHTMLLPPMHERRKGEHDADVLLGLAKLDDADSLEEAAALLSQREKFAVLGHRTGFERLCQLAMADGGPRMHADVCFCEAEDINADRG
jgi:membrane glycosyltransferase